MQLNVNNSPRIRPDTIAKFSFLVFLFFTIFGTSLPFQEKVATEYTSNPVTVIVFIAVLLLSITSLINKREELFHLILKEKFLFLFLLWALTTVIWSQNSFISFKRFIQIIATVTACIAILLHTDSSEEVLKYFKWILYPYLVLSLLSVFLVSGAIDVKFGTWRALTYTKNNLGQVGLAGVIVSAVALKQENFLKRMTAAIMFAISLALLIGSQSMTSIVTTSILGMIVIVLFVVKFVFPDQLVGRFLLTTLAIGFLLIIGIVFIITPDVLLELPQYVGKNATFTGRDRIWYMLIDEINKHPFHGCGFSGFWVFESDFMMLFEKEYFWVPNQAHNGYLDILNETGYIGLGLIIIMVIKYMWHLLKIETQDIWKWLLIATIIINFLETTLFRPRHLTGVLFIFAYLALYSDKIQFKYKHPN